jgi:hypothetical protein
MSSHASHLREVQDCAEWGSMWKKQGDRGLARAKGMSMVQQRLQDASYGYLESSHASLRELNYNVGKSFMMEF